MMISGWSNGGVIAEVRATRKIHTRRGPVIRCLMPFIGASGSDDRRDGGGRINGHRFHFTTRAGALCERLLQRCPRRSVAAKFTINRDDKTLLRCLGAQGEMKERRLMSG